jgi:hypothetical protein
MEMNSAQLSSTPPLSNSSAALSMLFPFELRAPITRSLSNPIAQREEISASDNSRGASSSLSTPDDDNNDGDGDGDGDVFLNRITTYELQKIIFDKKNVNQPRKHK